MVRRKGGMVGRGRGRPSKTIVPKKTGTKMLVCGSCGVNDVQVDADTSVVTCSQCTQQLAGPPAPPKAGLTDEQKALKLARKEERIKAKAAKQNGQTYKTQKDLGFGRGWWFKRLFQTSLDADGKTIETRYFSLGKEITKVEYAKLEKDFAKADEAKNAGKTHFGQGWHFKKHFVAPNGDVYSRGKLVTKAGK